MIHLDSCGLHDTDAIASNLRKVFNNFSASRRCTKKTLKVVNLSNGKFKWEGNNICVLCFAISTVVLMLLLICIDLVPQQRYGSNDCGICVVLYYQGKGTLIQTLFKSRRNW